MLKKRIVSLLALTATLAVAVLVVGCRREVYTYVCQGPSGQWTLCVGVRIRKAATDETINASSIYETREVDPAVYGPHPNATATGTVTLTLASGSTVTHSQNLYYDSSTVVSPFTAGYQVLVYRPVNPTALQNFISQYKAQTVEFSIDTDIPLKDISGGSVSSSPVDSRGHYNSSLEYHGTVNTEPPSRGGGGPIEM